MKGIYSVTERLSQAMQASEDVTTIINIAATAEAMAVTLLGGALANASKYDNGKGLSADLVKILTAAQVTEQAHYSFLTGAGAKPLTTTFNVPDPKLLTDSMTLFKTIEQLEAAFISAYAAGAHEFAAMSKPELVKVALQIAGTEGEHRALARLAQGVALPHNLAFEAVTFSTLGEAAKALQSLGFIGGNGQAVSYSDFAGKVDNSQVNVMNLTPDGSVVPACQSPTPPPTMPKGMPNTGEGGGADELDRRGLGD